MFYSTSESGAYQFESVYYRGESLLVMCVVVFGVLGGSVFYSTYQLQEQFNLKACASRVSQPLLVMCLCLCLGYGGGRHKSSGVVCSIQLEFNSPKGIGELLM